MALLDTYIKYVILKSSTLPYVFVVFYMKKNYDFFNMSFNKKFGQFLKK